MRTLLASFVFRALRHVRIRSVNRVGYGNRHAYIAHMSVYLFGFSAQVNPAWPGHSCSVSFWAPGNRFAVVNVPFSHV